VLGSVILLHLINDAFVTWLAPLLPRLIREFDLSLAVAATLPATLALSTNLSQPIFGVLGDRFDRRWFVTLGPLATVLGLSLIGVAPNVGVLLVILFIGGFGTAAFHPPAAVVATREAPPRLRPLWMSLFVTGGAIGAGVGPLVVITLVEGRPLWTMAWAAPVVGAVVLVLFWIFPSRPPERRAATLNWRAMLRLVTGPLRTVWMLAMTRALAYLAVQNGVPIVVTIAHGRSDLEGAVAIAVHGIFNAIGGVTGGFLATRYGRRKLITISALAGGPLYVLAMVLSADQWLFVIALAVAGAVLNLGAPLLVVVAQDLVPDHVSTASGLMMGFAWGVAGLFLIAIGGLQEAVGPVLALILVMVAITLSGIQALWLRVDG
jgi:FSR family fosmidomycin resistance protein-like MFS transporter